MRGEKYEDTINPCVHGHTPTIRYTASGHCVECTRVNNAKTPLAERLAYNRAYKERKRLENPTRIEKLEQTLLTARRSFEYHNDPQMVAVIEAALAYKKPMQS